MSIPDKYRDRYDRLAASHPWMREMRDEPELTVYNEASDDELFRCSYCHCKVYNIDMTEGDCGWGFTFCPQCGGEVYESDSRKIEAKLGEPTNGIGGETNGIADKITLPEGDAPSEFAEILMMLAADCSCMGDGIVRHFEPKDVQNDVDALMCVVERDYVSRQDFAAVCDNRDELREQVDAMRDVIRDFRDERDEWKARAEGSSKVRVGQSNLEWLLCESAFSGECKMAMYSELHHLPKTSWNSFAEFNNWLMALHDDGYSKPHSKTEPNLTEQSELLSDANDDSAPESVVTSELVDANDANAISDNLGQSRDFEIDEPDTIRNELEDKGYVVMTYHNGEKQAKLHGKEFDQVIIDELQDSREKLEADVCNHIAISITPNKENDGVLAPYATVLEWLDRQAAITKRECENIFLDRADEIITRRELEKRELQSRIDELEAELEALNKPISKSNAPKSMEIAENATTKCDIRDLDDSREKLEADVGFIVKEGFVTYKGTINLLDRQAAITESECRKPNWDYCETCEALEGLREALDQQRAATANANDLWGRTRDELAAVKAERDNLADDLLASNREREHLRRTLGIALDHAHDMLALVNLDGEVVS